LELIAPLGTAETYQTRGITAKMLSEKDTMDRGFIVGEVTKALDNKQMVVACGSDENFAMPLAVMLYSLVSNIKTGTHVHIYVLSLGITCETQNRLRGVSHRSDIKLTLDFIEVNADRLDNLPSGGHISPAAYLRLFIPALLPEECDKVLYLDSDMLIRHDVTPLWELDVKDYSLLAAPDALITSIASEGGPFNWKKIGIPADNFYFNSGVLLLNLKKWREENLTQKALEYVLENREQIKYHDQEALNAVCYDSWAEFDMTWNVMVVMLLKARIPNPPSELQRYIEANFDDLWNRPAICHFASPIKPWTHGHKVRFQAEWFKYLKRSGWFTTQTFAAWFFTWGLRHIRKIIARKVFKQEYPRISAV
jgi:lipopolysaccharide biosynthesis glycosyltransferase